MNYNIIKKIPNMDHLVSLAPLSEKARHKIEQDRLEIKNILEGKENRLLLIIGPCSAWPRQAVIQYAEKLLLLEKKVRHAIKIVMRVYIQKPRTTKGWVGPVIQPDPFTFPDIAAGMQYAREMMVKVVEMGLPIADEALFTQNAQIFLELLSWVAIGARSSEDQEHRIFASAISCPVGMKNPTHGSLKIAVNSIVAAQHNHIAALDGYEVETKGNPHAHLVLRGSGEGSNFSNAHLDEVQKYMGEQNIKNPAVMIDTSHDNCLVNGKKHYHLQSSHIFETLARLQNSPDLQKLVKGFMVESFLKEGNQPINLKNPEATDLEGLSITDPCIGWEQTEEMVLKLAKIKR